MNSTFTNSEDSDKIFNCLLRQKYPSEKELQSFFKIITCDFSIYTTDHPDLTKSNFMKNSIGLQWVNKWKRRGSVVECLTRDLGARGLSLTRVTVLCP